MMKWEMMPTVTLTDLCKELRVHYDINITQYQLRQKLWFEPPANDCYKPYYYGDGPCVGADTVECAVIDIFENIFPDWDTVLIDVTW